MSYIDVTHTCPCGTIVADLTRLYTTMLEQMGTVVTGRFTQRISKTESWLIFQIYVEEHKSDRGICACFQSEY